MTPVSVKRPRAVKIPKTLAASEHGLFFALLKREGLPLPRTEVSFALTDGRKFRWDFAWLDAKLALEVQGGIWVRGAHGRGTGLTRDHEKFNLGAVHGWRLLQVVPKNLCQLSTVALIRRALDPMPFTLNTR